MRGNKILSLSIYNMYYLEGDNQIILIGKLLIMIGTHSCPADTVYSDIQRIQFWIQFWPIRRCWKSSGEVVETPGPTDGPNTGDGNLGVRLWSFPPFADHFMGDFPWFTMFFLLTRGPTLSAPRSRNWMVLTMANSVQTVVTSVGNPREFCQKTNPGFRGVAKTLL